MSDGEVDHRAVADSVEILDSQTDIYEGEYDLRIEVGSETFDLTIAAPNFDFEIALDAARDAGRFVPAGDNR